MFSTAVDRVPGPHRVTDQSDGERTLADLLAAVYVCAYFVVHLEPFVLQRETPGSASWAGLPVLGIVTLLMMPTDRLRRVKLSLVVVALAVWMAASTVWAYDFGLTNFTVRSEVPSLVLLCLVAGAMYRVDLARTLLWLVVGIGAWGLFASLTMVDSRTVFMPFGDAIEVQEGWRGTFIHKNLFGVFAVIGLTTVLAFARRGVGRWAMIVLFVVSVAGSRSATAASGALIVAAAWSWLTWLGRLSNPSSRVLAKLVSMALMVIAVTSVIALLPTIVAVYGKDVTFSGRTLIWSASIDTIQARPWTGYGAGGVWVGESSPLTYDLYRRIGFPAAHAHSGAIDVVLSIGLVGLVLTVLLLISTVREAIAALRDPATVVFGRWGVVSTAALFVMALSEPLLQGGFLGFITVTWALLANGRPRRSDSKDRAAQGTGF